MTDQIADLQNAGTRHFFMQLLYASIILYSKKSCQGVFNSVRTITEPRKKFSMASSSLRIFRQVIVLYHFPTFCLFNVFSLYQ